MALDDDKLVVVGDGTDAVTLTSLLRKKLGYADLISVSSDEKEKEDKEEKGMAAPLVYAYQYSYSYPYVYLQNKLQSLE